MSNRTIAAIPSYYRVRSVWGRAPRGALKALAHATMRARERAAIDALRHGADPDALALPTRQREVADRWCFD